MEIGIQRAELENTRHLKANVPGAIEETAALLRQGRLVAFPTDTVYGVGADAFNEAAIRRLYQVKERPFRKGIPILLADPDALDRVAGELPALAAVLTDRFWPGPLTVIVPKSRDLPAIISPDENLAVRIPDHNVARALIRAAGGAVATSSANRSGCRPAPNAAQALADLGGRVAAVLDDGPSPGGLASTVVDCTGALPKILREGPIQANELAVIML